MHFNLLWAILSKAVPLTKPKHFIPLFLIVRINIHNDEILI
jgi:hypothetical protein